MIQYALKLRDYYINYLCKMDKMYDKIIELIACKMLLLWFTSK